MNTWLPIATTRTLLSNNFNFIPFLILLRNHTSTSKLILLHDILRMQLLRSYKIAQVVLTTFLFITRILYSTVGCTETTSSNFVYSCLNHRNSRHYTLCILGIVCLYDIFVAEFELSHILWLQILYVR